jgi:hypothetical protein
VRDPNVPYRLMKTDRLPPVIEQVPADFHLANVFVSALVHRMHPIHWVDIHFRERSGGVASAKSYAFVLQGLKLFKQLRKARPAGLQGP